MKPEWIEIRHDQEFESPAGAVLLDNTTLAGAGRCLTELGVQDLTNPTAQAHADLRSLIELVESSVLY